MTRSWISRPSDRKKRCGICRLSAKEQNQIISYIGQLPTRFIDVAIPNRIFHIKDTVAIDCGCGFGGRLGVLRLDDMEEMYF